MLDSYIRDYEINLLENTFNDDLERLKALCYGLDYVLSNLENNIENNDERYNYNRLTTCYITMKEIIEESDKNVY